MEFLILMKVDFFLPQRAQFDKSTNLCLDFLTLEFSFSVFFLQFTHNSFPLVLYDILHRSFCSFFSSHYILLTHLLKQIHHGLYTSQLKIRTWIAFNFVFSSKTPWSCFSFFFFFFDNWLLLFNSCSDCTNFYSCCRTWNTNRNTN